MSFEPCHGAVSPVLEHVNSSGHLAVLLGVVVLLYAANNTLLEATVERATGAVALWDIVLYMVELAELAARLAAGLHCRHIGFDIALAGVAGRELIAGHHGDHVRPALIVDADRLSATRLVDSQILLADPWHPKA